MRPTLYIAARSPRPGFTKTRLGRVIGHDRAAALYAAFLADLATQFRGAPFATGWYVTPPDAWPEIAACLPLLDRDHIVVPQPEGDWATRQRALFAGMGRRREHRTVLIASDSPQIERAQIERAFDLLEWHDLVLGPVRDGGYYLIGMRDVATSRLLDALPMSHGAVLTRLLARAHSAGLSVGMAEPAYDVDEIDDLDWLRASVATSSQMNATRAALIELGLMARPLELVLSGAEAHRWSPDSSTRTSSLGER